MNEADSVFAKVDSLVEVPCVEPSFLGCFNVKSIIPRSHGIRINDMNKVMCYRTYDTLYVYAVLCYVQNIHYDYVYYSHGIVYLIQILKDHKFS